MNCKSSIHFFFLEQTNFFFTLIAFIIPCIIYTQKQRAIHKRFRAFTVLVIWQQEKEIAKYLNK